MTGVQTCALPISATDQSAAFGFGLGFSFPFDDDFPFEESCCAAGIVGADNCCGAKKSVGKAAHVPV